MHSAYRRCCYEGFRERNLFGLKEIIVVMWYCEGGVRVVAKIS